MGDAENTPPPSKKRAAGRELSRDNPGLDDEEVSEQEQEAGTFKRASEEVLANRRIVKVRRNQTPSTTSAPSSNPFAAIRLVPSTDSTPVNVTSVQETVKTDCEVAESPDNVKKETETELDKVEAGPNTDEEKHEVAGDVKKPESADAEAVKSDEKKHIDEGNVEKNSEAASVSSFHHLSSSQNAFTGLVGTGFSSSTFVFGSISKNDQPSFPSFSFGTNGNSPLFSNPAASASDKTETPSMQEIHVETGEENEKTVFTAPSVLFEFLDGGWKERGKGELKVNVLTSGAGKARLVMRARGNYRLVLNASLFSDMKLTNMEKKGVTFACVNSTGEEQNDNNSLSTFALKFKDASIVEEFQAIVTQHKGNNCEAELASKVLENPPKASDE